MYTVRTPELKSIGICKKRVLVRTNFPEQTYAALYNKQSLTMSARPQIMKYPQTCAPKPSNAEHQLHPNDNICNTGAILGSNTQNHAPSVPVRNGSCVRTTTLAPDCRGGVAVPERVERMQEWSESGTPKSRFALCLCARNLLFTFTLN